jgi:hypothetical protein
MGKPRFDKKCLDVERSLASRSIQQREPLNLPLIQLTSSRGRWLIRPHLHAATLPAGTSRRNHLWSSISPFGVAAIWLFPYETVNVLARLRIIADWVSGALQGLLELREG